MEANCRVQVEILEHSELEASKVLKLKLNDVLFGNHYSSLPSEQLFQLVVRDPLSATTKNKRKRAGWNCP